MNIDTVKRGVEIVSEADRRGTPVRLFGGGAVAFLVRKPIVERPYPRDLDFACLSKHLLGVREVFVTAGYEEDFGVTRLFGGERRRFRHRSTGMVVDLCIDRLRFSRVIDLRGRLLIRPVCIPVSDLLLSKLQPKEITTLDLIDVVNLLAAFEPSNAENDGEFDVQRVASACSRDWGLFQLVTDNVVSVAAFTRDNPRCSPVKAIVLERITALRHTVSSQPKSMAWRLRVLMGKRFRYWNEVSAEDNVG